MTLGHTNVTGFSKQPGEEAAGGELITVYGTDLEFINSVELLDPDSVSQLIDHKDFYRKGTSNLIFRVPKKDIYDGTFVGYLHTYDGQKIALPELTYKPAADEGHWEIIKNIIWENPDPDGNGPANWNGTYRFAPETNSTGEEIATIPTDIWEKMKTEKFYMLAKGSDWVQMRIVTGWWNNQWPDANDITTGNEMIIDNGDGTYYIELDLNGSALAGSMDAEHLLFTGSGFTPLELYFEEEVWVGGGDSGSSDIDIAAFTLYEDRSANLEWPYFPSWGDNSGKLRIMRGLGDKPIETLGLTTASKFIVYKEAGTTGQIQWNNPNWASFSGVDCSDWEGSAETLEVPVTEDMLKCISGEITDGWSDTAIILQGDGLKVTKIVIVP